MSTSKGYDFSGKRCVVTGAGKGIGYDLSVAIAKAGAEVIAVTRTQADLDALVAECGSAIHPVLLDIADTAAVADALGGVGDIDMVVNNAGIANLQPFLEVDAGSFDQVMNINVRAAMQVSQIAAKSMIARGVKGSIVNVSSQASQIALGEHTSYCVSKGAMDQLTRMMALELGPEGIRTNAVNPTVVLTALGRAAWSDPAKAGPMLSRIPIGRFAETKDVVDPVLFLLSDQCEMLNGAMIPIEGGFWST
jgi:L-xylulose reductase